ncbi:MAG TPA: hypothetical protein VJT69_04350 [Pyrinomonadaceae bacterium]|nr:hypothetical protein [Pyrinomonadaceae bacterium]
MFVLLCTLVFVCHVAFGFYSFHGFEAPPELEFLYRAAFVCAVVWWLRADERRSAVTPMYCQGMLVGIGWLIIIPYHLLKTRGVAGLIPLLALMLSPVAGRIASVFVYLALPN